MELPCSPHILVVALAAVLAAGLAASLIAGGSRCLASKVTLPGHGAPRQDRDIAGTSQAACAHKFALYDPSAWELEWQPQLDANPKAVCAKLRADAPRAQAWLAAAASHKSGGGRSAPNVSDAAAATDAVLSR